MINTHLNQNLNLLTLLLYTLGYKTNLIHRLHQKLLYIFYIVFSFFLLNIIKHFVRIFSYPISSFSIPISILYFVVRPIIISCVTINMPNDSVIWLRSIIAVFKCYYMCTLVFLRNFRMFRV